MLLVPVLTFSQVPEYYNGIDFESSPEELKTELSDLIILTHTHELQYTPEVWDALEITDLDPENQENVLLIYGYDDNGELNEQRTRDKDLSCHTSSCEGKWVREHVYAKSLGTPPFETEGPGSDAHALRSVDSQRNNMRSNRKFADGEGNSHIDSNGFFYPGDEWKGDVARMMMYMHLRYGTRCQANGVGESTHIYNAEMPDIFLEWNAEDPVAENEVVRNDVLENMQGNRNPFIDNPYLATMIWGGPDAENLWPNMSVEDAVFAKTTVYPNPAQDIVNISSGKMITSVELFSTVGMKLKTVKTQPNNVSLNLAEFNDGIYFLLIHYSDNSFETKKIILN
jgi:endonuclease I